MTQKASINLLGSLFQSIPKGLILLDDQGSFLEMNPEAEKILGGLSGNVDYDSIYQTLSKSLNITDLLMNGKKYADVEMAFQTEKGPVHCLVSALAVCDQIGVKMGAVIALDPMRKVKNLGNHYKLQPYFTFDKIIGQNKNFLDTIQVARMAAEGTSNILLLGESGTGKEIFAKAIHNESESRDGPFVPVNCGAIPRELLSSELFGYVDGAFTGAKRGGKAGKFELAAGGTLFLDEIGEMPLGKQVSLLRAIQEKAITRIGDDKVIPVDVRIICASNKNLKKEVEKGNFRLDLYYRLNVISILLPPLREHKDDIELLFTHFIREISDRPDHRIEQVDPQVLDCLLDYDWPGNIRELQNVVERMVSIANGSEITLKHLPPELLKQNPEEEAYDPFLPEIKSLMDEREKRRHLFADEERKLILSLLLKYGGNISKVSRDMGVSRNTIYRKIKQYHITE